MSGRPPSSSYSWARTRWIQSREAYSHRSFRGVLLLKWHLQGRDDINQAIPEPCVDGVDNSLFPDIHHITEVPGNDRIEVCHRCQGNVSRIVSRLRWHESGGQVGFRKPERGSSFLDCRGGQLCNPTFQGAANLGRRKADFLVSRRTYERLVGCVADPAEDSLGERDTVLILLNEQGSEDGCVKVQTERHQRISVATLASRSQTFTILAAIRRWSSMGIPLEPGEGDAPPGLPTRQTYPTGDR